MCSRLLNRTESIIVGILLDLSLVVMHPSSKAHVVFLFFVVYVYFLMFYYSSIVHIINVMELIFSSTLSKSFFKVTIWYGFAIGPRIFFPLSFLKGRIVMGMKLIYFLFINTSQTTAAPLFQINCCSSIQITSVTLVTCN